jgi:hypothetical protein
MSAKNFKFVSPGVFIEEIDNSQLPQLSDAIGPVVIGRSRRGPAFMPTTVQSFSEFVTLFGDPVAGQEASDQWRSGVPKAPTFAAYAAQAWLKNSSPLTFVRLLGDQSSQASNSTTAKAGWSAADSSQNSGGSVAHGGGAYGLFLIESGSTGATLGATGTPERVSGTLAAVIYSRYGAPVLSGTIRGDYLGDPGVAAASASILNLSGTATSIANSGTIVFSVPSAVGGAGTTTIKFSKEAADLNGSSVVTPATSGNGSGTQGVLSLTATTASNTTGATGGTGFTVAHLRTLTVGAVGAAATTVTMGTNSVVSDGTTGAVTLPGGEDSDTDGQGIATGSNVLVKSLDGTPNYSFKLRIVDKDGAAGRTTSPASPQGILEETVINFNRSSNNYIRKVLEHRPNKDKYASLVNTTSDNAKSYFLGQTYERSVKPTLLLAQVVME